MSKSRDWRRVGGAELTPKAKRYLKRRGVSLAVAELNDVRSLTAAETAAVWGPKCRVEAIVFPFGEDFAVGRLFRKQDNFRVSGGRGARVFVPKLPTSFRTSMEEVLRDPRRALLVGEGPTRVLAAISHGFLAIGISGCWNWQKDRRPLKQLREIKWRGRSVIPVFDADIRENPHVLLPFLLFGDWLSGQRKAHVFYVPLPTVAGTTTGLDDYLAAKGADAFKKLKRHAWNDSDELFKLRISAFRRTEGGLAELFVLRYADDVRYDAEEECWYAWNRILWERQTNKALRIQEMVKETVQWILHEAVRTENTERQKQLLRWSTTSDRKPVIRGAMDLASSTTSLRVSTADLDTEPHLLGTQNCIIDLRTGERVDAERNQLITRAVGVAFEPEAECPRWEQFIAEVMKDDKELIAFMQLFVGYLLFGGNPERRIFFLFGIGRNGKSVFLETLLRLLGDYGEAAKSSMIMKHRIDRDSESAQPFMLKLRGKRGITASEVDEGMQLDGGVVKDLTGNDMITVRGLHSAPVKFVVEGKIIVRCNHRPHIDSADQAVWDRVVEIPFERRFTEQEQDPKLAVKLREELAGILNWAIEGCRQYIEADALRLPAKVQRRMESYREDMDTVLQWLAEHTVADRKAKTPTDLLYKDYQSWCETKSRPGRLVFEQSKLQFASTLRAQGYPSKKGHKGVRLRRGLRLKA